MLAVCNGMPRSGSTLQYNIIRHLVERRDCGKGNGYWPPRRCARHRRQIQQWRNDDGWQIIKMHGIHAPLFARLRTKDVCLLYIYRDLRDVAKSMRRIWGYDDERILVALDKAVGVHRIITKFDGIAVYRFETAVGDLRTTIQSHATDLGLERLSETELDAVEKACSPSQLRSEIGYFGRIVLTVKHIANKAGLPVFPHDRRTLLHRGHMSNDKVGASRVEKRGVSKMLVKRIEKRYQEFFEQEQYPLTMTQGSE